MSIIGAILAGIIGFVLMLLYDNYTFGKGFYDEYGYFPGFRDGWTRNRIIRDVINRTLSDLKPIATGTIVLTCLGAIAYFI